MELQAARASGSRLGRSAVSSGSPPQTLRHLALGTGGPGELSRCGSGLPPTGREAFECPSADRQWPWRAALG